MAKSKLLGVCDSTGHVYGVNNLIIADCSSAPTENTGNTSSLAYVIALNICNMLV